MAYREHETLRVRSETHPSAMPDQSTCYCAMPSQWLFTSMTRRLFIISGWQGRLECKIVPDGGFRRDRSRYIHGRRHICLSFSFSSFSFTGSLFLLFAIRHAWQVAFLLCKTSSTMPHAVSDCLVPLPHSCYCMARQWPGRST